MTYPSQSEIMAWLTMLFGSVKWAFFAITIVLMLVGIVRAAINRFRKQSEFART
jgi:hypothetical protein